LLRNFPKRRARNARRRRKGGKGGSANGGAQGQGAQSRTRPQQNDAVSANHGENELRQDVRDGLARDTTLDHAGEKA